MTKTVLRVLCIEDMEIDAELLEAHLSMNGFQVQLSRVETVEDLRSAVLEENWDIALADYSLPHLNAVIALDVIRSSGKDLPVIVVSGTIGEARAIEMMRAGARDFIVKGDFMRLIPAIRREMAETENRRARHAAEEALTVSEQNFKRLADAMPQLVWTAAPDGRLTYANQRFYAYTGLTAVQAVEWGWTSVFQPAEALIQYKNGIAAGKDISIEHQLRSAQGENRWFLTSATPSRDENGKILEWYATSTDIHEQRMLADELRLAKSLAEQANEAKSAFLANMSHEIRTPLGAILGFAELMEDPDQTPAERLDCIATIRRNGSLLSKVINQILDLSKIESHKLEIERMPFSLKELLEDIRVLVELNAREKGLSLNFEMDGDLPPVVIADPTRLKQILINIVGNAVKFTDKGSVTVTSKVIPSGNKDSSVTLQVKVADTGMGISKDHAEKLFQPFVQVDNSMTRRYGGTGLGLNLSRKLAQAMGGDVSLVRSELHKGSTFICTAQVELPTYQGNQTSQRL